MMFFKKRLFVRIPRKVKVYNGLWAADGVLPYVAVRRFHYAILGNRLLTTFP